MSYFALPPDILERNPGIASERFLKLFNKFIDLPTEEERLKSWGLSNNNNNNNNNAFGDGFNIYIFLIIIFNFLYFIIFYNYGTYIFIFCI